MDLHIPCREPISHLMSQCNHKRRKFKCHVEDLEKEVKKCVLFIRRRFHMNLTYLPRFDLYCFNPIPIDPYIEYMSTILQAKKYKPEPYIHRDTNSKRKKSEE